MSESKTSMTKNAPFWFRSRLPCCISGYRPAVPLDEAAEETVGEGLLREFANARVGTDASTNRQRLDEWSLRWQLKMRAEPSARTRLQLETDAWVEVDRWNTEHAPQRDQLDRQLDELREQERDLVQRVPDVAEKAAEALAGAGIPARDLTVHSVLAGVESTLPALPALAGSHSVPRLGPATGRLASTLGRVALACAVCGPGALLGLVVFGLTGELDFQMATWEQLLFVVGVGTLAEILIGALASLAGKLQFMASQSVKPGAAQRANPGDIPRPDPGASRGIACFITGVAVACIVAAGFLEGFGASALHAYYLAADEPLGQKGNLLPTFVYVCAGLVATVPYGFTKFAAAYVELVARQHEDHLAAERHRAFQKRVNEESVKAALAGAARAEHLTLALVELRNRIKGLEAERARLFRDSLSPETEGRINLAEEEARVEAIRLHEAVAEMVRRRSAGTHAVSWRLSRVKALGLAAFGAAVFTLATVASFILEWGHPLVWTARFGLLAVAFGVAAVAIYGRGQHRATRQLKLDDA